MNLKPCFFGQGKSSLNLLVFGMFKNGAQPPADVLLLRCGQKLRNGHLKVAYLQI